MVQHPTEPLLVRPLAGNTLTPAADKNPAGLVLATYLLSTEM